ncbi:MULTISPECIES: DUF4913 domain-containing protein [Protofrankia]|uniref:DUF4913 domain-containing protein n=1 Tax=Frankiaceae TaxID=74712 RepID=UPI0006404CD7|nr:MULTISPECIES: DUF4913 domain-containing protein [Protofrankia]ONH33425.1 hypothetical protein BL254_19885 [Protofrankia sp. BMG5.30]
MTNPTTGLTGALADLAARLSSLETLLADLDARTTATDPVTALPAVSDSSQDQEEPLEPAFAGVTDWVEQYFRVAYPRSTGGEFRWCAQWWDHLEAVIRLEALWRAWEHARTDPNTGIATWHTTLLDPQLAVLCGPSGPFRACRPDRHEPDRPLPVTPTPPGHFNPAASGEDS